MNHIIDFNTILKRGITLESSGSTGQKKIIFQTPQKIRAAAAVACQAQNIDSHSRILTVCRITHAAGLLAQTLPALWIGAKVDCVNFNAWYFVRHIRNYSHSHITPLHAQAIMQTKGFQNLNLQGLTITCGAEPVHWSVIEAFVSRGAKFIVNWGMTEVGPIAINSAFESMAEITAVKKFAPPQSTLLGHRFFCDVRVDNNELWVSGDIVTTPGWLATGDLVTKVNDHLFYQGRKNFTNDLTVLTKA